MTTSRVCALLAVLVFAGTAIPTSRADGETEIIFRTPSGNIVCDTWFQGKSLTDNQVTCALLSSQIHVTYQCPDVGIGCPDVYTLNPIGRVTVERASFQIGARRVLGY